MESKMKTAIAGVGAAALIATGAFFATDASGDVNLGVVKCSTAQLYRGDFALNPDGGGLVVRAWGQAFKNGHDAGVGLDSETLCYPTDFGNLKSTCLAAWKKANCP